MSSIYRPLHAYDGDTRIAFADRLRYNLGVHGAIKSPGTTLAILDETIQYVLPGNEDETPLLLADLIDPDVCGNTLGKDSRSFHCSKCDGTVQTNEMIVPEVSGPYGMRVDTFRYCPYCGRKIEDSKTSFSLVKGGWE